MSSKLREALEEIVDMGTCYFPDFTLPKDDNELQDAIIEKAPDYTSLRDDFIKAVIIARAALSTLPRNCDVGTAEEQSERFEKFCVGQDCGRTCPLSDDYYYRCEFAWGQLPYEEGDEK